MCRELFVIAATLSTCLVARADTYTFSISPTTTPGDTYINYSESGVLTTENVGNPYSVLVTGISGPNIIALVPPSTDPWDIGNDNLLYPGIPSCFDTGGISFTEKIDGVVDTVNLFGIGYTDDGINLGNGHYGGVDLTMAPTPEPSGIALLGTGLLGVAGVVRKRNSRSTLHASGKMG